MVARKAIRWIKGIRIYKTTLENKKERESMNQEELDKTKTRDFSKR